MNYCNCPNCHTENCPNNATEERALAAEAEVKHLNQELEFVAKKLGIERDYQEQQKRTIALRDRTIEQMRELVTCTCSGQCEQTESGHYTSCARYKALALQPGETKGETK